MATRARVADADRRAVDGTRSDVILEVSGTGGDEDHQAWSTRISTSSAENERQGDVPPVTEQSVIGHQAPLASRE